MSALFADTFFWIALAVSADRSHQRALAFTFDQEPLGIVTTDEVLVEYLNFFSGVSKGVRREVAASVVRLLASSAIRVIPQSRGSFLAGLQIYRARPDKGYSLTDCISMQTMRNEGLTEALTNDRHFEQEGFRALFRG